MGCVRQCGKHNRNSFNKECFCVAARQRPTRAYELPYNGPMDMTNPKLLRKSAHNYSSSMQSHPMFLGVFAHTITAKHITTPIRS